MNLNLVSTELVLPSPEQRIETGWSQVAGIELFIKRDDLIHPVISGNKWRKLKYNLLEMQKEGLNRLLTFGGAHSNHLAATAEVGRILGVETIGIVRGDELNPGSNGTLRHCASSGMELHFLTRSEYRLRDDSEFLNKLRHKFAGSYVVPEGGANAEGMCGCAEVVSEFERPYDFVFLAAGTGTTAAGMITALHPEMRLCVVPVLKGNFLRDAISQMIEKSRNDELQTSTGFANWEVIENYEAGGYAKMSAELVELMREFYRETDIKLDPVYTAKAMLALKEQTNTGKIPHGSRVLFLHTGGLQGIPEMEKRVGTRIFP